MFSISALVNVPEAARTLWYLILQSMRRLARALSGYFNSQRLSGLANLQAMHWSRFFCAQAGSKTRLSFSRPEYFSLCLASQARLIALARSGFSERLARDSFA